MDNLDFYKALFSKCTNSVLSITTLPDRQIRHYPVNQIDKFAADAKRLGASTNTYFNLNPRRSDIPSEVRGRAEDITFLTCIASDHDVFGPAHKTNNLPPSKETVLDHLHSLPQPPTVIIDSGYGIYGFWILREPFPISDLASRDKAAGIVSGFGKFLMERSQEHGWALDNVFDLPRMLRTPGSYNFKLEPPVQSKIISGDGPYYDLADFESYYEAQTVAKADPFEADERTMGNADRIMENCKAMQKLLDDPEGVSEPLWHALCSNAVLAPSGAEKFHDWSSLYSGYRFEETEYKILRASESKKPCTCQYIHERLGFECPENGCGVTAPIVLAQYTKQEQIRNLLAKDRLTAEEVLDEYTLKLMGFAKEHCPADYSRFKVKIKKTGVGLRDFDRAVRSEMEKQEPLGFDIEPTEIILDGIDLHGAMEPPGYRVSIENGVESVYYENNCPMVVCLCHEPVVITRRLENIDSGQEKMELSFYRNNRWKTLTASRSTLLSKSVLVRLADSGLPVSSDNAEGVVRYLTAYEATNSGAIPFTRSIDRIGWLSKEFYPYMTNSEIGYEGDDSDGIINALCECGDYSLWLKTMAELRKSPFARAVLAGSFASPLLELTQHRVILMHIWNSSRSGKTAALKFGLSCWGDPMKLMGNFNSTAVGLERRAGTLKHLPLGLDELQVLNDRRLPPSLIVYALGNGYGKTRGAKNGGLQNVPTWRNCVISTGEQPLSSENSMDGVNTRVLEFYGQPIEDVELGRRVHQISECNYGFAGKRFISFLIQNVMPHKEKLIRDFNSLRNELKSMFDILSLGDPGAHLDNIAVLALADRYSSECLFGLSEADAVREAVQLGFALLQNVKNQEKEDVVERAWHYTEDWVASNRKRFCQDSIPCYGAIEANGVYIIGSVFRQALEEGGFSYTKSIKGFREKGYIETSMDSDGKERSQHQKRVQGINVRTFYAKIKVQQPTDPNDDFLADPVGPLAARFGT